MPDLDEIVTGQLDEWLDALAPYQRKLVGHLLHGGKSPEDAAIAWLSIRGPANTAAYGGAPNPKFYLDYLLNELEALLCGDKKYAAERKRLLEEAGRGRPWIVGAITAAIAGHLGIAAAVLGPAVVLVLAVISKMGLKAWCKMRSESRATSQAKEEQFPC